MLSLDFFHIFVMLLLDFMNQKQLIIDHLSDKLAKFSPALQSPPPEQGWLRLVRKSLGMSMVQLASKLNISKQGVKEIELREQEGGISLNTLRKAAQALDMKFIYGFVPIDGSLPALIERKAIERAKDIITRTAQTMSLEDQSTSSDHIQHAIDNLASEYQRDIPKKLWD